MYVFSNVFFLITGGLQGMLQTKEFLLGSFLKNPGASQEVGGNTWRRNIRKKMARRPLKLKQRKSQSQKQLKAKELLLRKLLRGKVIKLGVVSSWRKGESLIRTISPHLKTMRLSQKKSLKRPTLRDLKVLLKLATLTWTLTFLPTLKPPPSATNSSLWSREISKLCWWLTRGRRRGRRRRPN